MKDKHIESQKRLAHILNAIEEIEAFVKDESLDSFCENFILNHAVLYNFSIIGEAIIHVEESKLEKYDYPWYKVRAFRNMIAHEYFNIRLEAVWPIISKNLPELKAVVIEILKREF